VGDGTVALRHGLLSPDDVYIDRLTPHDTEYRFHLCDLHRCNSQAQVPPVSVTPLYLSHTDVAGTGYHRNGSLAGTACRPNTSVINTSTTVFYTGTPSLLLLFILSRVYFSVTNNNGLLIG
jgi:hypothetical protein